MAKVSDDSSVTQASFEDQGCSKILTEATAGSTSSTRRIQNNQNEVASETGKSKKNWSETEGTQHEVCEEHTLWSRITQALGECVGKTFGDRKKNRHILRLLRNHDIHLRDHGKKLVLGKLIAEGGQAEIYEAEWENKDGSRDATKSTLVFKVFKQTFDPCRHCPLEELRIGNQGHFTAMCHGVTQLEDGRFAFVFQRYWGDLETLIRKRRRRNPNSPPFFLLDAIRTMLELARGMRNLHITGLLHRDLRCSNILIDCGEDSSDIVSEPTPRFSCNIADYESSLGIVGTGFWRAPEILRSIQASQAGQTPGPISPHTEKADVYAYAMTCYEVLTGRFPLEGIGRSDYDAILIREQRPALPDDLCPWIRELLQRCWHTDPSERPAFHEIEDEIIRNRVEASDEVQERSEILRATTAASTSSSRTQNTSHCITHASEVDVEIEQSKQHCQSELRHHEHSVWSRVTKKFQRSTRDREVLESLQYHNMCLGDYGMDFFLGKLIAEGEQAEIYEAEWANKSGSKCNLVFKVSKNPYTLQDLPLEMLRRGNQCHFTAMCHGVTQLEDGRVAFVLDRYWGDLETLIRKRRELNPNAPPFFLLDTIRIMLELARGMRNLHMKGILHGDLKPANILVDCRDSDDIVSKPRPLFACNISTSMEVLGTRFWKAPESLRNAQAPDPILSYTEKADVYAYAMTCYEVLTGLIPGEGIPLRDYDAILIREQRPALPDDLHSWISELLQKCWHADPSMRPAFHEIEDDLIQNGL